jgi:hypothetical protein
MIFFWYDDESFGAWTSGERETMLTYPKCWFFVINQTFTPFLRFKELLHNLLHANAM